MSKFICKKKKISLKKATLKGEIWKDVVTPMLNKGEYKVSNLGRIYSTISGRLITLHVSKRNGYIGFPLGDRSKRKSYRIHRLIAQAFIPNPENKKDVNHKNKNKLDNRVENLEWMTPLENARHKYGNLVWCEDSKILPSYNSVVRRKLKGFPKVIQPIINELVPLNSNLKWNKPSFLQAV